MFVTFITIIIIISVYLFIKIYLDSVSVSLLWDDTITNLWRKGEKETLSWVKCILQMVTHGNDFFFRRGYPKYMEIYWIYWIKMNHHHHTVAKFTTNGESRLIHATETIPQDHPYGLNQHQWSLMDQRKKNMFDMLYFCKYFMEPTLNL